jgi:hypothetical protein
MVLFDCHVSSWRGKWSSDDSEFCRAFGAAYLLWRRKRESNPCARLRAYELSKPAPSATWVFLHAFRAAKGIIGCRRAFFNVGYAIILPL